MSKQTVRRIGLQFDDNELVPFLFGEHDSHLNQIEEELDVEITARGNELVVTGSKPNLRAAQSVFDVLWERLTKGMEVGTEEVTSAIAVARSPMDPATRDTAMAALKESHVKVKARNKNITARSAKQAEISAAADEVDTGNGVIVVTDMFGGSPSNLSLPACASPNRRILYGANLPMLIKLAKSRGLSLQDATEAAMESGRKYINSIEIGR